MPAPPDALAPDALHALAALTPTLRALGDKGLSRPNTSGPRAVEATLALVAQAKRERGALAGIFIIVPPEIDDLPARALAFWAAGAQHDALRDSPRGAATRQKRVDEAKALRQAAVSVLGALGLKDRSIQAVLETVRSGTGHADLADDLNRLYPLLLAQRARIEAAQLLDAGAIDRVGELAPLLLAYSNPRVTQAARLLRDQAFTHLTRAFQRVRRHVAFLYDERGDHDIALPALSGHH